MGARVGRIKFKARRTYGWSSDNDNDDDYENDDDNDDDDDDDHEHEYIGDFVTRARCAAAQPWLW